MFSQILLLLVVSFVVDGCSKTGYKRHGEACQCTDTCLDNAQCQRDGSGGFACLCLPCQYLDTSLKQCVDIPGYGEECSTLCEVPYVCTTGADGRKTCQACPTDQYFDEGQGKCVNLPTHGEACKDRCACNLVCQADASSGVSVCSCSSDSTGWNPLQGRCSYDCFPNNTDSCKCVPNGHYPACLPLCQDGVFVSCLNNTHHLRECSDAWYVRRDSSRFTARMVYDPRLGRCERSSSYCPRPLDEFVEG
ncbi:hypothetical protein BsWGS_15037 [Bradybaena similaris]